MRLDCALILAVGLLPSASFAMNITASAPEHEIVYSNSEPRTNNLGEVCLSNI
jgi:hypothetical protein